MPKCPRCVQTLFPDPSECPHCGFHLSHLHEEWGDATLSVKSLNDVAGLMRRRDREKASKYLDLFHRQFPQLKLYIHVSALSDHSSIRQYAVWLLNQIMLIGSDHANEYAIVILIDANSKLVTLTQGYQLEPYFKEEDSFRILSSAHASFVEEEYVRGIELMIKALMAHLRKRARQAKRHPLKFSTARKDRHPSSPRLIEDHRTPYHQPIEENGVINPKKEWE